MSLVLGGIMGSGSCLPVMAAGPNNGVPNQPQQQGQGWYWYVVPNQQQQQGQGWNWYVMPNQQPQQVQQPPQQPQQVQHQARANGALPDDFIVDDDGERIPREEYERELFWMDGDYIVPSNVAGINQFSKDKFRAINCAPLADWGIEVRNLDDIFVLVAQVARNIDKGFDAFANYEKVCESLENQRWDRMDQEVRDRFNRMRERVYTIATNVVSTLQDGTVPSEEMYKYIAIIFCLVVKDTGEFGNEELEWQRKLENALGRADEAHNGDIRPYGMIQIG